jgi:hypothetical protein
MLIKKNNKNKKRGNESRRIREQEESNLEDEKDLDNYKKGISSEENNNINSSIDIEKLKINKKEEKPKKKKSKNKLDEMDNALLQLEQKNKEQLIKGELYDLLEEIEDENKDFKKNVFFSNFHELNNNLGIFDDINEDNKNIINNNYVGVKGDITSHGLIDKYTEKAEDLKINKKKKKK